MENEIFASLTRLSDAELVARLVSLAGRERDLTAQLVAHLAELLTRDVHLREGYSSPYLYCRAVLRLSEWEAYNRLEVAQVARRFPLILDLLADGSVHLTTVKLLGPHLTPVNHRDVLESARGKSKMQVKEIVALLSPQPDVPASVRRIPAAAPSSGRQAAPDAVSPTPATPPPSAPVPLVSSVAAAPVPVRPAAVTPLSRDRYKLQLTIWGDTLEKLRLAQDMLGHAIPSGDDAAVLDRALTILLSDLARKKFADTLEPRPSRGTKLGARYPSAEVKRVVWVRDLGRCAFVGTNGHRCNERRFLEFHHVVPYILGGEATVDNIQLRCRRHNDYEGRQHFGRLRRSDDRSGARQEPDAKRSADPTPRELVPEQVQLSVTYSTP